MLTIFSIEIGRKIGMLVSGGPHPFVVGETLTWFTSTLTLLFWEFLFLFLNLISRSGGMACLIAYNWNSSVPARRYYLICCVTWIFQLKS